VGYAEFVFVIFVFNKNESGVQVVFYRLLLPETPVASNLYNQESTSYNKL